MKKLFGQTIRAKQFFIKEGSKHLKKDMTSFQLDKPHSYLGIVFPRSYSFLIQEFLFQLHFPSISINNVVDMDIFGLIIGE